MDGRLNASPRRFANPSTYLYAVADDAPGSLSTDGKAGEAAFRDY